MERSKRENKTSRVRGKGREVWHRLPALLLLLAESQNDSPLKEYDFLYITLLRQVSSLCWMGRVSDWTGDKALCWCLLSKSMAQQPLKNFDRPLMRVSLSNSILVTLIFYYIHINSYIIIMFNKIRILHSEVHLIIPTLKCKIKMNKISTLAIWL